MNMSPLTPPPVTPSPPGELPSSNRLNEVEPAPTAPKSNVIFAKGKAAVGHVSSAETVEKTMMIKMFSAIEKSKADTTTPIDESKSLGEGVQEVNTGKTAPARAIQESTSGSLDMSSALEKMSLGNTCDVKEISLDGDVKGSKSVEVTSALQEVELGTISDVDETEAVKTSAVEAALIATTCDMASALGPLGIDIASDIEESKVKKQEAQKVKLALAEQALRNQKLSAIINRAPQKPLLKDLRLPKSLPKWGDFYQEYGLPAFLVPRYPKGRPVHFARCKSGCCPHCGECEFRRSKYHNYYMCALREIHGEKQAHAESFLGWELCKKHEEEYFLECLMTKLQIVSKSQETSDGGLMEEEAP